MLARATAVGALCLVSACGGLSPLSQGLQQTVVLDRAVGVTAPDGYCVDPEISRPRRGFAFLAACAALDPASEVPLPPTFALVTVQAGASDSATVSGSEQAFRDFLRTEQGRTLLAAGDMGGPIEILSTDVQTNLVQVYTRDLAPPTIVGTQAESWRAFTDVGGRTVTVTVRGLLERPLSQTRARSLLNATVSNLSAVSAAPAS